MSTVVAAPNLPRSIRSTVVFLHLSCMFVASPWPSWAQTSADKLCSSAWFTAQRKEASAKGRTFQLLDGGVFVQDGSSYLLVIGHAAGSDSDLDFSVFTAVGQSLDFRAALTERIAIVDTGDLAVREGECSVKASSVFFKATVVDLAGNGKRQILVESNEVGTCGSCLSEVRVYEVEKDRIVKVVKEMYNEISFGKGKGLWIHSFRTDENGRIVPVEKTFFGAKHMQEQRQ